MSYNTLIVNQEDGILTIQLNRPKQLNAISNEVISELNAVLDLADQDGDVRAVILTGSDKVFSAGADISEIRQIKSIFGGKAFSQKFQKVFGRLEAFGKPVIAAIRGFALGGGFELMLGCDLRVVAEDAKLGLPEVMLGALPAGGGTVKLARTVGLAKAKELLFVGDPIPAQEALRLGLINRVVPADKVMDEARSLAKTLSQKAPLAIRAMKGIVQASATLDLEAALELEAQGLAILTATDDFKEGTAAFFERRKPNFKGK